MFKFPFTNFHELNLDWILSVVKQFSELVPPMESAVDDVQQALGDATEALEKSTEALENANEAAETANEAKDIAEDAAQGVIADGAVTTPKIHDGAVTMAKLATALQDILKYGVITSNTIPIPAEGASATYSKNGLTADHFPIYFGFSSSPENQPPCTLEIVTTTNGFTITNVSGTTEESIIILFAKSFN